MPLTIQCPNLACNAAFNVADAVAGRKVKCKKCGTLFKALPTIDGEHGDTKPNKAVSSHQPFAALPAEFGRYRVLKKLGQGGMGAVYLAEDTTLGRKVALKLPAFDAGEAPKRIERFVREARSSAVLQHPNICTVFDAGEIGRRPFISMAFIDGKPLEDLIDPDAPLPQARVVELVRKIALGLAHAHAKGIVHRDLKPANVMLTADGEPVVMDFGLAKRVADIDPDEARLTRDGAVMGTPSYMAPEQVNGETDRIGPATDVYALGVILFELLTGRTPFSGPIGVVMAQILTVPAPAVRAFRPDADPRLEDLCRQAMAKDPADRPASMAAFAARLDERLPSQDTGPAAAAPTQLAMIAPPPAASLFDHLHEDAGAAAGGGHPEPPTRGRRSRAGKSWGPLAAGAAVLGALVIGAVVVLTVRGKHGEVVIELSDPTAKADVKVDGDRIELTGLDKPLTLTVGEHGLTVTGGDFEAVTQQFTVKKGDRQVVKVTLKPKAAVAQGPKPKETIPPPKSPPTPAAETPKSPPAPEPETPKEPAPSAEPAAPVPEGFVPLFTGKDLAGWEYIGNTWEVAGGAVTGKLAPGRDKHTYLCSRQSYKDFEIRFQVRLKNGVGNSGLQVRSKVVDPAEFIVAGPQVEIEAVKYAGVYGEKTTGKFMKEVPAADVPRFFKAAAFNDYVVRCVGKHITVTVNGTTIVDDTFPEIDTAGIIAFQLHGTAKVEELTIKDAVIKDLSAKAAAPKAPAKPAAENKFVPLFNGKDLTGWKAVGTPKWSWAAGRLTGTPPPAGGAGYLMTEAEYDNFELELQYKLGAGTGSGLFLRGNADGDINGGSQMEVQILDDAFPQYAALPVTSKTGSLYSVFPRTADPPFKKNDWNAMRVRLDKRQIQVWVNGVQTINASLDDPAARDNYVKKPGLLRPAGRIGLQVNQKTGVEFRDVKIKPLAGG